MYNVTILDKQFKVKANSATRAKELAAKAYRPRSHSIAFLMELAKVEKI